MQGQRLILFTLLVTATSATQINFFGAYMNLPIIGNQSTVEADRMILWANVTDCPAPQCLCEVVVNASTNALAVNFTNGDAALGLVNVEHLQPNTLYSFKLICVGATDALLDVRTDYGRPSPPREIGATLQSRRVHLSWLRPELPAGPIHNYRLAVNGNPPLNNLPGDRLFYDTTEDYVYGATYTFVLSACNTNNKGDSVCSDANQGLITFTAVGTTTPNAGTTTPSTGNGLLHSIALPIGILCVLSLR